MATVIEPDSRPAITPADLDYGCLHTFMDVVYGAVMGFGVYEVGKALEPLLQTPPGVPSWATLALLAFVSYYLVADVVEARIYTARFPYTGRDRFIADILIAACFLFAYMAAGKRSSALLLAMGGTMIGGGIWSVFLENATKYICRWSWPRILAVSHLAAGFAFCYAYYVLFTNQEFVLDGREVAWIWILYLMWDVGLIITVRVLHIPVAEADLLPVGLVESVFRRVVITGQQVRDFVRGRT